MPRTISIEPTHPRLNVEKATPSQLADALETWRLENAWTLQELVDRIPGRLSRTGLHLFIRQPDRPDIRATTIYAIRKYVASVAQPPVSRK